VSSFLDFLSVFSSPPTFPLYPRSSESPSDVKTDSFFRLKCAPFVHLPRGEASARFPFHLFGPLRKTRSKTALSSSLTSCARSNPPLRNPAGTSIEGMPPPSILQGVPFPLPSSFRGFLHLSGATRKRQCEPILAGSSLNSLNDLQIFPSNALHAEQFHPAPAPT